MEGFHVIRHNLLYVHKKSALHTIKDKAIQGLWKKASVFKNAKCVSNSRAKWDVPTMDIGKPIIVIAYYHSLTIF